MAPENGVEYASDSDRRESSPVFVLVRLRRGVVGESQRTTHLVDVTAVDRGFSWIKALCGERMVVGETDLLTDLTGMPCESCLIRASAGTTPSRPGGDRFDGLHSLSA
ncbi:hypothetical protein [Kutzneria sp. CA-103260]|uniref:hypothetical protein n=1 Tax=Kutzneria sp. CA-103260 TaxID=2802641 RepID=UPI001BEEAF3A|nr:hypothetical protein [Kutzneria sp. CA-103260]QUQ63796.1 hypothetical protein JJ691_15090 [Kutzneria sp. CA-103260]